MDHLANNLPRGHLSSHQPGNFESSIRRQHRVGRNCKRNRGYTIYRGDWQSPQEVLEDVHVLHRLRWGYGILGRCSTGSLED